MKPESINDIFTNENEFWRIHKINVAKEELYISRMKIHRNISPEKLGGSPISSDD